MASDISEPALRLYQTQDPLQQTVPYLLARILEQKGAFRHVNEDDLERIVHGRAGEDAEAKDPDTEGDQGRIKVAGETVISDGQEKDETSKIAEDRLEVLQLANQAYNESAQALDFISLLLSAQMPAQASSTLSPFVKETLPLGSLGVSRTQALSSSAAKQNDDQAVASGWKIQSLQQAADAILQSATRLEADVRRETRYWEEILTLQDQSWSLCHMPRDRKMVAAKFGSLEAGAEFRDRGLVALRRGEEGQVLPDLGTAKKQRRRLQTCIVQNGKTLAQSNFDHRSSELAESSPEDALKTARDCMFDDELFHELFREARSLTNRGLHCLASEISFPISSDRQLIISWAEPKETPDVSRDAALPSEIDDQLLDALLSILRLGLHRLHWQRHAQRTQKPLPLGVRRPPQISTPILAPLVAQFEHTVIVDRVRGLLEEIQAVWKTAGLELAISYPEHFFVLPDMARVAGAEGDVPDKLFEAWSAPLTSVLTLTTPSQALVIEVLVRTQSQGTSFKIITRATSTRPDLLDLAGESDLSLLTGPEAEILHLLQRYLIADIVHERNDLWEATAPNLGRLSSKPSDEAGAARASTQLKLTVERSRLQLQRWRTPTESRPPEQRLWTVGQGTGNETLAQVIGRYSSASLET